MKKYISIASLVLIVAIIVLNSINVLKFKKQYEKDLTEIRNHINDVEVNSTKGFVLNTAYILTSLEDDPIKKYIYQRWSNDISKNIPDSVVRRSEKEIRESFESINNDF